MEVVLNVIRVLANELCDRMGPYGDACREWFKDQKRRRMTYAVGMFVLSLLILSVYACSQRPNV